MKLRHKQVPFAIKSLDKDGTFAGMASVFGNIDKQGDVVTPGAFGQTLAAWKAKDALPPVLWQHNSDEPIGAHTSMIETPQGLDVQGQLLVGDVQKASEAYALLKAKVVRGMSIGYDIFPDGCSYDSGHNIFQLNNIDLWENSIVTFPANDQALITEVKDILASGDMPTLRQVEKAMRELGFSKKHAKAIASGGYANLIQRREAADPATKSGATPPTVDDVCKAISDFQFHL